MVGDLSVNVWCFPSVPTCVVKAADGSVVSSERAAKAVPVPLVCALLALSGLDLTVKRCEFEQMF